MKNRTIDLKAKGTDQTLRDLINNLGVNDASDICVTELMASHKPTTVHELTQLCNQTGKMTLQERCVAVWQDVKRRQLTDQVWHQVEAADVKRMVLQVIVLDTWCGFEMEQKAVQYFQRAYTDHEVVQYTSWDKEYSVDLAIQTKKGEVVLGIQVKPKAYEHYDRDPERARYKQKDKANQQQFQRLFGAGVRDLFYDKTTKEFTNLDSIAARMKNELVKRKPLAHA